MATVKEIFYEGILEGNWENIRTVYEKITGEEAPIQKEQNTSLCLNDILNEEVDKESNVSDEELDDKHLIKEKPKIGRPNKKKVENKNTSVENDFYVKQNISLGEKNGCRKEPMFIPESRKNTFFDDGKEAANERVDLNPDDVSLGIKKIRDRENIKPVVFVNAKCYVCGKIEKVPPSLAASYSEDDEQNAYRCNDCNKPSCSIRGMDRN